MDSNIPNSLSLASFFQPGASMIECLGTALCTSLTCIKVSHDLISLVKWPYSMFSTFKAYPQLLARWGT